MEPVPVEHDQFFDKTSWSTVLKAKAGEGEMQLAAMDRLLGRYRRPIILDIKQRKRCDEAEAEELAHRFIHDWLRRDFLK